MRIAILAHSYYPIRQPYTGGLEAHTHQLAIELTRQGHTVTLYAKAGSDDLLHVIPIFWGKAYDGRHPLYDTAMRLAMTHIRFSGYDLIINNTLNGWPLRMHTADMPYMVSIFHTPAFPKISDVMQGQPARANREFLAVSRATADEWQPYCPQLIRVVDNGVDMSAWLLGNPGGSTPDRRAVWMGRITPEKGTHIAIQACIASKLPLTIAGPVYDKTYFKSVIKPLLENQYVSYVGALDQPAMNRLYQQSDVSLVTPLWEEPFGLVAVEALASGTPVAALPMGALPTIVNDAVGSIAADITAEALAAAIPIAMQKDRAACRRYVETTYTLTSMVESYLANVPEMADDTATEQSWQTIR